MFKSQRVNGFGCLRVRTFKGQGVLELECSSVSVLKGLRV